MSEEKIIREFPIEKIPYSCIFVVIGAPGTGKSTFIEDLCYVHKHRYPTIRAFSGTEDTNAFYQRFIPKLFIENEYDDVQEKNYIIGQKKRKKSCRSTDNIDERGTCRGCTNCSSINIIDDCSDDPKIYKTKEYRYLFKNGRHLNHLLVIGLQYAIDLGPDLRKCISYVVLFREPSKNERDKLYKNFGGICGSRQDFDDMMDQLTGDHTCMVIQSRSQSNESEDNIFYYKARLHESWRFGCREMWDWHRKRFNKKFMEDEEDHL